MKGQPLVMMEGLAAKCKVVASDKIPGLPNCVVSAEFNNTEDWVNKIKIQNRLMLLIIRQRPWDKAGLTEMG